MPRAVFRAGLNFNTSIASAVGGIALITHTPLSACIPSGIGRTRIFGQNTSSSCGIHGITRNAATGFVIHPVRVGGTARGIGATAVIKFHCVFRANTIAILVNAVFGARRGFNAKGVVCVPNITLIALASFFGI